MEAGMITSDEPGVYIEGSHGIRTENLVLCVEDEKNEYGQFLRFEYLTYVPIDLEVIDREIMSERDVELLNRYHEQVYMRRLALIWMRMREYGWRRLREQFER